MRDKIFPTTRCDKRAGLYNRFHSPIIITTSLLILFMCRQLSRIQTFFREGFWGLISVIGTQIREMPKALLFLTRKP